MSGGRKDSMRWALLAVAVAGLVGFTSPAGADDTSKSTAALYAPFDLDVVDVEATVAIATKAGDRVPIVLTQDLAVAPAVAATFSDAFGRTHGQFVGALENAFGVPRLEADALVSPEFRAFRADFQAANLLVPVSPALAQTWARGFDGEPVRERIATLLQAIERDQLIGEIRPASSVFLVAGAELPVRSWGEVGPRARVLDPGAILSVPAAGEFLQRTADPLDRAAVGYLSGLLRPNVAEDRYLTGLLLRERLGSAVVHRAIARGTQLADAGQPVDAWAQLALENLARLGIRPVDSATVEAPEPPAQPAPEAARRPRGLGSLFVWLAAGLALGAGCIAAAVGLARTTRRGAGVLQVTGDPATREATIPHVAREWKDRLVRALFTQRSVLLANEQAASRRVQEMEERLARLQPAIAERIRGYEQRIDALEKEIAERDAETRELLRAKLVLARKELDAEIARNRITWN